MPLRRDVVTDSKKPTILVAVLVLAAVALVVVAPGLVARARSLFTPGPPPNTGALIQIPSSLYHPSLAVRADRLQGTKLLKGPAATKARRLVVVRLEIRNTGAKAWVFPLQSQVSVADTLGVAIPADSASRRFVDGKSLAGRVRLVPGRTVSGLVVFSVPKNREVREIRLLPAKGEAEVHWDVTG